MAEEIDTQRGRLHAEADIVIWRSVANKADRKPPLIVVECKADNVTINKRDYGHGNRAADSKRLTISLAHAARAELK